MLKYPRNAGTCNFKAMQACCWGSARWGLRNAPEKALHTSIAAQLGVRNGKLFPLKGVRIGHALVRYSTC